MNDFRLIQVEGGWRLLRLKDDQVQDIHETDEVRTALKELLSHVAPELRLVKKVIRT